MESRDSQTAPFLKRLPTEIRLQVFRNLLCAQYTKQSSISQKPEIIAMDWAGHGYDLDPKVLQTSRQVYSEGASVLYHENIFVRVRSIHASFAALMDVRGIPSFLQGRRAGSFRHCAMSVDLDRLDNPTRTQGRRSCYIIALDDLQLFCQIFMFQHMVVRRIFHRYKFKVTIHQPLYDILRKIPIPPSHQRRLLEPFTMLHSVPHFQIAGPVNPQYSATIVAKVSRSAPTLTQWLASVTAMRDQGHEHAHEKDFNSTVEVCKTAISHILTTCSRDRVAGVDWDALPRDLQVRINDTFVDLILTLASAYYNLDRYQEAHFWAWFPTEARPRHAIMAHVKMYAKLVFLRAMASARLDCGCRAVRELCDGLNGVDAGVYDDEEVLGMRREVEALLEPGGCARLLRALGCLPPVRTASPDGG